jgi:hypothetical protein
MKRVFCVTMLALSLLIFSTSRQSSAQSQQSAEGRFSFTTEDDVTRYVEFSAAGDGSGKGAGSMIYNDTSRIPDDDSDGDPPPRQPESPTEFYVKAEFDAVTVEKNRAIMSGVVRESSHKSYVGRWVQLVVEDNAENRELSDRLSWVFCRPEATGWVPSDAERKDDRGAYMSWWATDYERKDDVGIPSQNIIPGSATKCSSYTLSAYDYVNPYKWQGDIVVRP